MRKFIRNGTKPRFSRLACVAAAIGVTGCATEPKPTFDASQSLSSLPSVARPNAPSIQRVDHREAKVTPVRAELDVPPLPQSLPAQVAAAPVEVDELVRIAIGRNPRLGRATFAIDQAQGRYVQVGLYPNPVLAITADELGDRTGPNGILTLPQVSQEIVTGRKLSKSQAVAAAEVDQATLALLRERYGVIGSVRAAFYAVYAVERRIAILDELVRLAGDAVKNGQTLLDNKQIARLDLVQLEVELARFRSQVEAAKQELPGARLRLAAAVGDPRLTVTNVTGPFEDVPRYDPVQTLDTVLATHPEIRSARVGVERAQAAIRRAEVEPIPNLTVSSGYTRQNQNQSNDWLLGVSAPIPAWNRNQGNIRSAKAELGMAIQDVARVENELADRVAVALQPYLAALKQAELYRKDLLPKAEETYKLSLEAFKGGQFEYLRVIQAQRAVAEARLEYNRALGDAWRTGAELSALLLEEWWPGPQPIVPGQGVSPKPLPVPGRLDPPK